jgi:hypothetical protein
MEDKLELIAKEISKELRRILGKGGSIPYSVEIEFQLSNFRISFSRITGKNKPEINLPIEVFEYLKSKIIEIQKLWDEEGKELECFETHSAQGQSVEILIEGLTPELAGQNYDALIIILQEKLNKAILEENYEEASRLKNRIDFYKGQL